MSVVSTNEAKRPSEKTAVTVVDCDVHPMVHHSVELADFAPEPYRSLIARREREAPAINIMFDSPDWEHAHGQRTDAVPPDGGFPCTDPEFSFQQLIVEAGVDIAILQPFGTSDARTPEIEHALKVATNNWLADVWLDKHNRHERWRGSIYVTHQDPHGGAREIEKWAGHPYMAQVLMTPSTRGISFGDPRLDPIYEAASRNGLPVATHLSGPGVFDTTPIMPVGTPGHWADYLASWPLVYMSHMMSLVFDGVFTRFPDLQVIFVEGSFVWALPVMWRMDEIWKKRRSDVPWVTRPPSEYIREHVWFTTQPLEDVATSEFRKYLAWMDPADLLLFSTDYPHWTFDDPAWARKRLPAESRDRVMATNAVELFKLPAEVRALSQV
jgi:uncharacterized protein